MVNSGTNLWSVTESQITDRPKIIIQADYRQPVQFFEYNVPLFNSSVQITTHSISVEKHKTYAMLKPKIQGVVVCFLSIFIL